MKDCTTCKYGYEDERLGIPGEKYIMLTDLEELPGFNEEKQNRI